MNRIKTILHYLSFLQYPFSFLTIYYSFKLQTDENNFLENINYLLIFIGTAISFATLADLERKKISDRFLKNKRFVKIFLGYLIILVLLIFCLGFYSMLFSKNYELNQISFGIIVFGIGVMGLLKSFIEKVEIIQKKTTNANKIHQ